MKNEITISTEGLGLTEIKTLAAICEKQSGFKYNTEIWVHLVSHNTEYQEYLIRNDDTATLDWMLDYILAPADEILDDVPGYFAIWESLDRAGTEARDKTSDFNDGRFYGLAGVAAEMLEAEHKVPWTEGMAFFYSRYGLDW